jgi:ribosomal protein S18 acetylase RimI-like enzyme
VFASGLPDFRDFNTVRLEGPDPGLSAGALAEVADSWQGELGHRRVQVEDEAAGARLRAGFERLGWRPERLAWLHRRGPAPPAGHVTVEELTFAATHDLRRRWVAEWAPDPATEDTFTFIEEAVADRRGTRAVAVLEAGEPVAFAAWWAAGEVAEIDQVYCLPDRRGRGFGGALVAAAIAAARADDVFIVAVDAGRAQRLYERLGFRPVWVEHIFTRLPKRRVVA